MSDDNELRDVHDGEPRPSMLIRLWLAAPDWAFRLIGVGLIAAYLATRVGEYRGFPDIGPYWRSGAGKVVYFPLAKILVDATFVLIGLAFCFRVPPRRRASRPREIVVPLLAAVWPLLPFLLLDVLHAVSTEAAGKLSDMLGFGPIGYARFVVGCVFLVVGNGLDLWGYGTLFRSVAIVAEARELKITGPYRLVRHPVYLGQFIAQAGVWLVLVKLQAIWVVFYALFVAMQLYRSRVEEQVLERTFGETYLAWKRRTFWFF